MVLRKFGKKARVAGGVLRNEGALALSIKSLQKLEKRKAKKNKTHIKTLVKYTDAIQTDFHSKRPLWQGTNSKKLTFNWILPPPGKGSGGHMTMFRFIQALEKAGHVCRLYFYTQSGGQSVSGIKTIMEESFPPLKASLHWLNEADSMQDADGIFATSWETAYPSYISKAKGKRFYFVQDFEPYFYAVGGLSVLAENTYRFGYHGITAGGWLAKKLNEEYGMATDAFEFGTDSDVYRLENKMKRKEVLCYVRPFTERRGFEIAIMALDLFRRNHPDFEISLFGWDVSEYDIPFPYNNLKILNTTQLNSLYNRCAAGLVLSATNMSLLPLELLASGCIPVVNDGENNRLVSNNSYIAFTANDPVSLAAKLAEIVDMNNLPEYASMAAKSVENISWEASTSKAVSTIENITRKPEQK